MARVFLFLFALLIAVQVAFSNRTAAILIILTALYILTRRSPSK